MDSPNIPVPVIKYHPNTLGMQRHRGMWCLPSTPSFLLDSVTEFEMKPTDVMLVSYPKGGIQWLGDAVWLVHNKANLEKMANSPLETRVPFLEHRSTRLPDPLSLISSRDSPRLMMTHLASYFFDHQLEYRKPKVVMVLRDPRDTLVAQYDWYRSNPYFAYPGKWEDFFSLFHSKMLSEGDWFDHTLSWWEMKDEPNILILKFEELQRDPLKGVNAIAQHCGQKLTTAQCERVANYISKTLKEDEYISKWKQVFSQGQADTISRLFRSYFQGSGLSFRGSNGGSPRNGSPRSGSPKTPTDPKIEKLKLPHRNDRGRSCSPVVVSAGRLTGSPDCCTTRRSSAANTRTTRTKTRRASATPTFSPKLSQRPSPTRQDSRSSTSSGGSSSSHAGTQTSHAQPTQPLGHINSISVV